MAKKAYRVRNWREYNKALVSRGSIYLWIDEDVAKQWYESEPKKRKRGRPRTYSNLAIETCAILRVLYKLPYRNCQGFVMSIFKLMGLAINTPSYSQICKRQSQIELSLKHKVKGPIHAILDGTGLKIFGEGEWKVRQHGYSKRRRWRKLHIGIDAKSKEIVMAELTDNNIGENKLFKDLLNQYEPGCYRIGGDKAYDSFECQEEVARRGAESAIPPQKKSRIRKSKYEAGATLGRDDVVRRVRKLGLKKWKKEVDYNRRSLVETTMFRYKTIIGRKLMSYGMENQRAEALLACNILNKFAQLGLPESVAK